MTRPITLTSAGRAGVSLDPAQHRVVGDSDQAPGRAKDVADEEGRVAVAVDAVQEGGDVDVEDVADSITVESGMPWQMTSFRLVQQDFSKPR